MKKIYTHLLSLILLVGIGIGLNAQTLTFTGTLFLPQDSILFTYNSPSFSDTDWIGIYGADEAPGGPNSTEWSYIPNASGSIYVQAPDAAGTYKAFLLCCDGYDTIAISTEFTVEEPVLSTEYSFVIQGNPVVFTYKSPKFNNKDKIAIYATGIKPGVANPAIDSKYIASAEGSLQFSTALTAGKYDAYLLCCDGYDSITSCTFEVKDASKAFVAPKSLIFEAGASIDFIFNDPSYAAGDWIAIYNEGDDPALVSSVTWGNLSAASGVVSFPGVLAGGNYFGVIFCCGGTETEYARSEVFEVLAASTGTWIRTGASVYPEATPMLVNYKDLDYTATDWIGIYNKGEIPGGGPESTAWAYAPADSGTVEFEGSLMVGDYVVYLLCCDGYTIKAKYSFKVVGYDVSSIVSAKLAYEEGEDLEFYYNSPNYVATDWVGVYHPGEIPGGDGIYSIIWKYLPGSGGIMTYHYPDNYGENVLDAPLPPGEYWAGLFCCDAYELYAMAPFVVRAVGTSVKDVKSENNVNIFPNPTNGLVTVKISGQEKMQKIVVYSLAGQELYQENIPGLVNEKTLDLKLSKGIYFMEVQSKNFKVTRKLVIQ